MPNTTNSESIIDSLLDDVARRFGRRLETTTDFVRLAEAVAASKAGYVSPSTLKRYWGYVRDSYSTKRISTLDILARYIGFASFSHYASTIEQSENSDSDFNSSLSLDVQTLSPETEIEISWHPDRMILARYLGKLSFRVIESRNSRLKPGDHIKCMTLVKGHPLIMTVSSLGKKEVVYIAGKQYGIEWRLLR